MEKIIVAVFKGKGHGEPYKFYLRLFDSIQDANNFVAKEIDLQSKYWTFAKIVNENEDTEIYYHN